MERKELPYREHKIVVGSIRYIIEEIGRQGRVSKWLNMNILREENEKRILLYVTEVPTSYLTGGWLELKKKILEDGEVKASVQPGELEKVLNTFGIDKGFE